jgi:acetyl esterase/lipase
MIQMPAVWDRLSAKLAAKAGFKTAFLSGSCVAASSVGGPDLDLVSFAEMFDSFNMVRGGAPDTLVLAHANLGAARDDNFTSPVRADPTGLPPILIQVGSDEVLLSDSTSFAANAALAGIEVRLHVWAEMPHAFPLFHASLRAIEEAGVWMRARFAGGL